MKPTLTEQAQEIDLPSPESATSRTVETTKAQRVLAAIIGDASLRPMRFVVDYDAGRGAE